MYFHPNEAPEVGRHIDSLQSEGYLAGEPENIELEDHPGVQGLKSIRVAVDLESKVLTAKSERMVGAA